jgi:hypothetical protein
MTWHKHPRSIQPKRVTIGLFGFVMITSAALLSIRTFPTQGLLGWQSVSFNVAAIDMYLLLAAFVAAEMNGRPRKVLGWRTRRGARRCRSNGRLTAQRALSTYDTPLSRCIAIWFSAMTKEVEG